MFQTKEVFWVSARVNNTTRFISTVEPLTEAQVTEFEVPPWAIRKGRLVIRADARIFATPDVRLKKTAGMKWQSMDDFPFHVHFCYKDK